MAYTDFGDTYSGIISTSVICKLNSVLGLLRQTVIILSDLHMCAVTNTPAGYIHRGLLIVASSSLLILMAGRSFSVRAAPFFFPMQTRSQLLRLSPLNHCACIFRDSVFFIGIRIFLFRESFMPVLQQKLTDGATLVLSTLSSCLIDYCQDRVATLSTVEGPLVIV